MMNIKPTIVEESSNARQLELAKRLSELLAKVSGFKAMRKFEALLYREVPEGESKYYNKHNQDLAKTEFGFYVSERYGRTEFNFYRISEFGSNRVTLAFDIKDKSIPAIIEALNAHVSKLVEWKESENTQEAYEGGFCREIENQLNREYTLKQFAAKKKSLAAMLRTIAKEVEAIELEGA